jgi:hypothetical protein
MHNETERKALMKTSLVVKAGAVALFAALLAQSAPCLELSVGARLGLNIFGILGDTSKIMAPGFGASGEVFASEWINQSFGLQEEIGLSARGAGWKNPDSTTINSESKYPNSYTYLDIPILAKWCFLKRESLRPALYGGFTVGFPLVASLVYKGGVGDDKKSYINPVDFGLTAGLSLDIKRGNLLIPIDIRYTWGATNFIDKNKADYTVELHHSVFSLSVGLGWIFDLAKKGG